MSGSVPVLSRAIDRGASVLGRPGALVAAGVVLAVGALHLWVDPSFARAETG